jgi:hypothetical protein
MGQMALQLADFLSVSHHIDCFQLQHLTEKEGVSNIICKR